MTRQNKKTARINYIKFITLLVCFQLAYICIGYTKTFAMKIDFFESKFQYLEKSNPRASNDKNCRITGKVFDIYRGLVPNTGFVFRSNSVEKVMDSDENGEYTILLPYGIYDIELKSTNMFDFKRSSLTVVCNEMRVNLYVLGKSVSFGTQEDGFTFNSFSNVGNNKSDLVIGFVKKDKKANTIIYSNAILTYDKFTVVAEEIIYDAKNNTVLAKGSAWLEEKDKLYQYDEIIMKFNESDISIKGCNNIFYWEV